MKYAIRKKIFVFFVMTLFVCMAFVSGTKTDIKEYNIVYDAINSDIKELNIAESMLDLVVASYYNDSIYILLEEDNVIFENITQLKDLDGAWKVIISDLNDDDLEDFIATPRSWEDILVFIGDGKGNFECSIYESYGSNKQPGIGHFDDDNYLDIAIASYWGGIKIYKGSESGSYSKVTEIEWSQVVKNNVPSSLGIGDLNGDEILDIAVRIGKWIRLYYGEGDCDFSYSEYLKIEVTYPDNAGYYSDMITIDLNNDNLNDIVYTMWDGFIEIIFNSPEGIKNGERIIYEMGTRCNAIAVEDFNTDGYLDIAATWRKGVNVRLNQGDGSFSEKVNYNIGGAPYYIGNGISVGDLNSDGILDIVATYPYRNKIEYSFGDGNGGFSPVVYNISLGDWPMGIDLGDLNGAHPDLYSNSSLSWSDKPNSILDGIITIKNVDTLRGSRLNWEIDSYPTWGNWTFSQYEGFNLTPLDGSFTIQVSVVAPNASETKFEGEIRIVNTEDKNDYEIIPVCLTTPKNKFNINSLFFHLLNRISRIFQEIRY